MVMRNRDDSSDVRRWWDDLPRVRNDEGLDASAEVEADAEPRAAVTAGELVRDLSGLALLFTAVALANLLFLLLAVSFIAGH